MAALLQLINELLSHPPSRGHIQGPPPHRGASSSGHRLIQGSHPEATASSRGPVQVPPPYPGFSYRGHRLIQGLHPGATNSSRGPIQGPGTTLNARCFGAQVITQAAGGARVDQNSSPQE
ncbi:unnamed protein product [Arctogadus glacialis]